MTVSTPEIVPSPKVLKSNDMLHPRHIGVSKEHAAIMLKELGVTSLQDLMHQAMPSALVIDSAPEYPEAVSESEMAALFNEMGRLNTPMKSFLGIGYFNSYLPAVISRGILQNPAWYTQYTPYQAEISQGRLESLFNWQTMVTDLMRLDISNASLLDEPTAAAEAIGLAFAAHRRRRRRVLVSSRCNPNTLAVIKTRGAPLGIQVEVVNDIATADVDAPDVAGVLFQYPDTEGALLDRPKELIDRAHSGGALAIVAADLLASTVLQAPGDLGADIAVGSAQRFGVPMGYGGPHAGFIAARTDATRKLPGRLIGMSIDAQGNPAFRLTLQTREQHIRRAKAVSNICTAQALLANISSFYAIYHGPEGLAAIAQRVHGLTTMLANGAITLGHAPRHSNFFDTVVLQLAPDYGGSDTAIAEARARGANIRRIGPDAVGISLDETTTSCDVAMLLEVLGASALDAQMLASTVPESAVAGTQHARATPFLEHAVFQQYRSETDLMRYMKRLENRDVSLADAMTPLGSCTMKLNAASELQALTMPAFTEIHPAVPAEQAEGYLRIFRELEAYLCRVTGYDAISFQPNSGAQGELAGLLAIMAYHRSRGENGRTVCLIPASAHGTNPASATMAGMTVVNVEMSPDGEIDVEDLKAKCIKHSDQLGAIMVTYPSTYGVFDEKIADICEIIHAHGGQVYLDGANMNAQMNMIRPGDVGADVSHLNLHKTFCIPHGGGGPGQGPIGVKAHLAPHLPVNPFAELTEGADVYSVSGAPFGSSLITTISWAYCKMMSGQGLKDSSMMAVLSANYMMARLGEHYTVRFSNDQGRVAHEFIIDCSEFKPLGIDVNDVAKRLIDFGLHPPTMSWPVPNSLMIEPTESESFAEIDRYIDALIQIRREINEIKTGQQPQLNNVLKNAPHTKEVIGADEWDRPYPRSQAAYPLPWTKEKKWPTTGRVDDVYGDKNVVTTWTMAAARGDYKPLR